MENAQIDENRIAMEVTLFSDKVCVDEEIVRLGSHMEAMKECLIRGGAVGRKLDFIAQEMNREANKIRGSGCNRYGHRIKDNDRENSGTDSKYRIGWS